MKYSACDMDATHYNMARNTTPISPICSNIMQVESDMIIIYGGISIPSETSDQPQPQRLQISMPAIMIRPHVKAKHETQRIIYCEDDRNMIK